VGTDWVAKVNETAQEQVSEPVVAAGILQPAGTWGAFGLDQVSGVASMFKRRKVNKDAGGLAKTSDLDVETTPGKLATKVVFDVTPTGEHYELEATTVGSAGFNDPFLAAIA
jgi:hypothetical protein